MIRSIQIVFIVLLMALASVVRAQTPLTPCPTVEIDGLGEVDQGTVLVFIARVVGTIPARKHDFKWTVSAGTITSGQGTESITVDTTGLGGVEIIATVELSTASPACKGSSSRPTKIKPPIVCWLAFDEYGDITFEDEKARLDNFAIQISNEPGASGAILMFAGRETFKNETAERLARAKSYLANVRHIDPNRIVTYDCGFTQELNLRLWVVPVGLTPPSCDTSRTIPFSEVKFTKPRPKSSRRRR